MKRLREFLATCLYVGHIPGAPGTYGSILAVAAFVAAGKPVGEAGWYVFLAVFLVSIFALSRLGEIFGSNDPRPVVLDEFAGMWLAMLLGNCVDFMTLGLAFVLFRGLDILKPFPIRRLERLDGWRGVIADDLAAGAVAGLLVRIGMAVY